MKCDELKEIFILEGHYTENSPSPLFGDCLGYGKEEVDAAIAELKQKLEDAKATAYAESVDAGMRERRLRRALFKACANWAYATENLAANFLDVYEAKKWAAVYARCIKKAGEYK